LYPVVDTEHVVALNAAGGGEKGRVVIKEWALREDETTVSEDGDAAAMPFGERLKLTDSGLRVNSTIRSSFTVSCELCFLS
jgi:hypothetical protein